MESGVLDQGQGRTIWVVGDRYTIKTGGKDTGGAFALIEALVPPGGGPPPHRHEREDEAFYLLEGELAFHVDGRDIVTSTGAWITLAKGSLHHFKNLGTTPAKMLILVTPAGLEDFFLEVGTMPREGDSEPIVPTPEDIERLIRIAPSYGLQILVP